MKLIKKYHIALEIFFLVFLSFIPLVWFKENHLIYGSDSGYPLDYIQYFIQRTFTWTSTLGFGYEMSSYMGGLPLHGIQYVLSILSVPYLAIQKITLVFWFAAVAFSMYFCVRHFFNEPSQWITRIIAVILYCINFYIFLFWQIGSQTTLSAYVFLPLAFLISYKFITKQLSPIKTAVYFNLTFLLFNAGGVQGLPLLGPSIVVIFGLIFYQAVIKFDREYLLRVVRLVFFSAILFVLCNAYFLFPFLSSFTQQFNVLVSQSGGISGVISWTNHISRFSSYTNLFRLQGDNLWYIENSSYPFFFLTNPLLIGLSFIFPILAYINLLFTLDKRVKKLLFFLVPLSLLGVFLSAGSHDPLGFLYISMIEHVPGFAAFRSAYYKFAPLIYFSFAILCGMAVYYLTARIKSNLKILIPISFIVFLFIYHYPFYDKHNFLTNYKYPTMIQIPDHVKEFAALMLPKDDKYRTLVLPPLNRANTIQSYKWGYYGGYPVFPGISDNSYIENNSYLNVQEKKLVNKLYGYLREDNYEAFTTEAGRLSIKYILLTSDVLVDLINVPREDPSLYQKKLNNPYFKKIWEKGEWSIFEITNHNVNQKIFATGQIDFYYDNLEEIPLVENSKTHFLQKTVSAFNNDGKIPVKNVIINLNCTSCSFTDEELDLDPARIVPGSIFYPLKLYREEKALVGTDEEKIYTLLGFSLKRISEMNILSELSELKNDKAWIAAVSSIYSNWNQVDKLILSNKYKSDEAVVKRVSKYADFELTLFKSIYDFKVMSKNQDFKKAFQKSWAEIARVGKKTNPKITNFEENTVFSYAQNSWSEKYPMDLFLDLTSILKDNEGKLMYPYGYSLDDGEVINFRDVQSETQNLKLTTVNKSFERLHLFFPAQANQLEYIKTSIINFPEGEEECFISRIKNFKWYETYQLNVKDNGNLVRARAYIERVRNNRTPPSKELLFDSDVPFDLNKKGEVKSIEISLDENDTSPIIYFCNKLNTGFDITLDQISLKTIYKPLVFLRKQSQINMSKNPDVSFQTLSPTEYIVKVQNSKSPFILGFSERFSPFWDLYDEKNQLINTRHVVLNSYANGWYIEREGSFTLKIKYRQQEIFYVGKIISILSIFAIGIYFFIRLLKK